MCGMHKGRRLVTLASWSALQFGMSKFNVDGVARGKPWFAVIRGMLYNGEKRKGGWGVLGFCFCALNI